VQSWERPTKWSQSPVGATEMTAKILTGIADVFGRADKANKMNRALAPAKNCSRPRLEAGPFFRSLFNSCNTLFTSHAVPPKFSSEPGSAPFRTLRIITPVCPTMFSGAGHARTAACAVSRMSPVQNVRDVTGLYPPAPPLPPHLIALNIVQYVKYLKVKKSLTLTT